MRGRVEAIHTAPRTAEPMEPRDRVRVTAGSGLEGDRYGTGLGHWSGDHNVSRDVTLVEREVIEAVREEFGIELALGEVRRNVTTSGIRLNDLVGRRFRLGGVLCEGTEPCEPCLHLQTLVGKPVLRPLVHRGGLRARILTDGEIRVGDPIAEAP